MAISLLVIRKSNRNVVFSLKASRLKSTDLPPHMNLDRNARVNGQLEVWGLYIFFFIVTLQDVNSTLYHSISSARIVLPCLTLSFRNCHLLRHFALHIFLNGHGDQHLRPLPLPAIIYRLTWCRTNRQKRDFSLDFCNSRGLFLDFSFPCRIVNLKCEFKTKPSVCFFLEYGCRAVATLHLSVIIYDV